MIDKLGLLQPPNRIARDSGQALKLADEIGYPLVVRPSYVLGGRSMEIVYDHADLRAYMENEVRVSRDLPVLLDRFLDDAVEVDVDAVCDGEQVLVAASWSTSSRPACTRATRAARCRRTRCRRKSRNVYASRSRAWRLSSAWSA